MKVIGIRHKTGEYQGKPYDVYHLFTTVDNDKDCLGVCPVFTKVKASVLHQIVSPDKIEKLMNKEVNFLFDRFNNVIKVEVL